MREQIKNDVPELWRQRYLAGVCPVCAKENLGGKENEINSSKM